MAETWYEGRKDVYQIDPRTITVIEGFNPRTEFAIEDLVPSIRVNGVLVPLRISRSKDGVTELRDGERRHRAVMQLIDEGTPILTVPCIMEIDPATKKRPSDADMLLHAMLANTGKPFTALEESEGLRRFLAWGWTIEQLATRIGKSVGTVRASLALLDAAPALVAALQNGTVSRTEAVAVVRQARQTDADQGEVLAERQELRREKKTVKPKALPAAPQGIAILCQEIGPEEVINAVITYLIAQDDTAYAEALMSVQDAIAQRGVLKRHGFSKGFL